MRELLRSSSGPQPGKLEGMVLLNYSVFFPFEPPQPSNSGLAPAPKHTEPGLVLPSLHDKVTYSTS